VEDVQITGSIGVKMLRNKIVAALAITCEGMAMVLSFPTIHLVPMPVMFLTLPGLIVGIILLQKESD
jgi:hypothetical protein